MHLDKLQRQLSATARRLVNEHLAQLPAFAGGWNDIAIVLSGSGVTEFVDEHSGIDLIALAPLPIAEQLRAVLAGSHPARRSVTQFKLSLGNERAQLTVLSLDEATAALNNYDDEALATLPGACILHDPQKIFKQLIAGVNGIPPDVLQQKIYNRHGEIRQRLAAIAWNLRRGQPYELLNNLTRLLGHTLAICFYLDGRPPTGRKWLFQGALATDSGRRLRPHLFALMSSLGEIATLGGSFQPRDNALYKRLGELYEALQKILVDAGYSLEREIVKEGLWL